MMRHHYSIHDVVENDIEHIISMLHRASIATYSQNDLRCMMHNATYTMLKCISRHKNNTHEMAGFIIWHTIIDISDVITLCIHPIYRRHGLASLLIENMIMRLSQHHQQYHHIFLEVSQKNIAAIALYQKNLFEPINVRKNYYSDGEDAIIMRKTISR